MASITVFGDSIIHGGRDGGWPIRLRTRMWECGFGDQLYVQGVPGNTSFDLVRRMPIELPLRPTETIIIAIGTNDAQLLWDEQHPRITDAAR
jgi:lysophospholipase L1-like esterase